MPPVKAFATGIKMESSDQGPFTRRSSDTGKELQFTTVVRYCFSFADHIIPVTRHEFVELLERDNDWVKVHCVWKIDGNVQVSFNCMYSTVNTL